MITSFDIVHTTLLLTVANTAMHMAMVTASMRYAAAVAMLCGFVLALVVRELGQRDALATVDTSTELAKHKDEIMRLQEERKNQVEIMRLKTEIAELKRLKTEIADLKRERLTPAAPAQAASALTSALARVRARNAGNGRDADTEQLYPDPWE